MIPFYCLLKPNEKDRFLKDIQPLFNDNGTIKKAYYWGLWSPKKDRKILNSFLAILLKECNGFPDFEIKNNGLPHEIDNSVEPKMFKWILKPKEMSYSDFKITWMLSFRNKYITKVLKNIDVVKDSISIGLQENYNENVAKIYFKRL